jgi:magnesium-transporting ATPase (P-type)
MGPIYPEGSGQMDAAAIAKPMSGIPAWHAIATDDVLLRLNTDRKKGLDANEVSQRLLKYGPNRLPEGKRQGPFMRFLSQFTISWFTCYWPPGLLS